jgi:hypothetical protein
LIDLIVKMKLGMVNSAAMKTTFLRSYPRMKRAGLRGPAPIRRFFFDEPSVDPTPLPLRTRFSDQEHPSRIGTTMVLSPELQSIFNVADRIIMLERRQRDYCGGRPEMAKETTDPGEKLSIVMYQKRRRKDYKMARKTSKFD